jgi:hypothetical protein
MLQSPVNDLEAVVDGAAAASALPLSLSVLEPGDDALGEGLMRR